MNADDNENILISTGMHWKTYVVPAIASAVALCILTAITTGGSGIIQAITKSGELQNITKAADIIICAYVLYTGLSVILRNAFITYSVTESTVYLKYGIISRHIDGYSLCLCENISADQSVIDRILNTGKLRLSYNGKTCFRISGIKGFKAFSGTLENAVRNAKSLSFMRYNITQGQPW